MQIMPFSSLLPQTRQSALPSCQRNDPQCLSIYHGLYSGFQAPESSQPSCASTSSSNGCPISCFGVFHMSCTLIEQKRRVCSPSSPNTSLPLPNHSSATSGSHTGRSEQAGSRPLASL